VCVDVYCALWGPAVLLDEVPYAAQSCSCLDTVTDRLTAAQPDCAAVFKSIYFAVRTAVPPYALVLHSTTYHGYVRTRIILNARYNVIFV
jgi:hypothetical protein